MFSHFLHLRLCLFVVLCLFLQGCGRAPKPEAGGSLSARIISDDGVNILGTAGLAEEDFQWKIFSGRSQFQEQPNDKHSSDKQPQGSIILLGQSPQLDAAQTAGSVAIRFTFDSAFGNQPDSQVRYYPNGIEKRGFSSKRDGGSATVKLESAEFDKKSVRLRGNFQADLRYGFKDESLTGNHANFRNGSFDVVVPMVIKKPKAATQDAR